MNNNEMTIQSIIDSESIKKFNSDTRIFLQQALISENYSQFLTKFNEIDCLDAYYQIEALLPDDKVRAKYFRETWLRAYPNIDEVEKYKASFLKYRDLIMNANEKKHIEQLPDNIEIYRGTRVPIAVDNGISWSLNFQVAIRFAGSYTQKCFEKKRGRTQPFLFNIMNKVISKKAIITYFSEIGEDEIIYFNNAS